MKKKIFARLLITIMLFSLMPQAALAAPPTHPVLDGQTLDLSTGALTVTDGGAAVATYTIADDDRISVAPGASATITGSKNVMIDCGAGVHLTLDSVTSDVSATEDACALSFTGSGNTLTLAGTSSLKSGQNEPGVRVEDWTMLEIKGGGKLEVVAGNFAAGIGGGNGSDGGTIAISGGDIKARGGSGVDGGITVGGAGIGGGYQGSGGTINISGGDIEAAGGGYGSAGIGGGDHGDGGTIAVSGGTVTATGSNGAAGIGGGKQGDGGDITISGDANTTVNGGYNAAGIGGGSGGDGGIITIAGNAHVTATGVYGPGIGGGMNSDAGIITIAGNAHVTATGGLYSAGIGGGSSGGGQSSTGGTIKISGGVVYASKHKQDDSYDIGKGWGGSDGTIEISGTAAVFLGTDTISPAPTTATHTHCIFYEDVEEAYGFDIPSAWTPIFGAYLHLKYNLDYDANGGKDTPPSSQEVFADEVVVVKNSGDLYNEGYEFDGWNTADDGSGTPYVPGDALTITADTTLYAQWAALHTVSYNSNGAGGAAPSSTTGLRAGDKIVIKNRGGLSYAGHVFNGWNTKDDGTGTPYAPGDEITAAYSMTLYAQWTVPVTSVSLGSTSETMAVGDMVTLAATVSPGDATYPHVTWASSDESIATVDSAGKITAVGFGSATITAEADGKFDTCTVTVVKTGVTGVTLSSTSKTMDVGDTATLSATVNPSGATYPDVTWFSTNTSVARVNQSGQVTAVSAGAAAIVADADGAYAVCAVLVASAADSEPGGNTGGDTVPTATPTPTDGDNQEDVPDTGDDAQAPTVTPNTVIIKIVVSGLPEGTAAIRLPNGEVVELDGSDTLEVEVGLEYLSGDGSVELVALDDEGTPLGVYDADGIMPPDTGSAGGGVWPVLMWVLIGIAGAGAAGLAAHLTLKRRRGA